MPLISNPCSLHSQEITMRNMWTMNHLWCFPCMKNCFPCLYDQGVHSSFSMPFRQQQQVKRQAVFYSCPHTGSCCGGFTSSSAVALLLFATLLTFEAETSSPSARGSITSGQRVLGTVLQNEVAAWTIMNEKL